MIESLQVQPMNLYADWIAIARGQMVASGYDVSALTSDEDVARAYMNVVMHLTVPVAARQVYKAADFVCPPAHEAGLAHFEAKVTAGQTLRPHMSRATSKVDNRDGLLYDWGIHHFHLGTVQQADGYMQRTGPLLYAVVRDEALYMISVVEHGAWTQQEVLRKVYANWPTLLAHSRMKGATAVERNFTDDEVAEMRKANISLALCVAPGVFISPPGGGMTASGHNLHVIRQADSIRDNFEYMQASIQQLSMPAIIEAATEGFFSKPNLEFKFVEHSDGSYALLEVANNYMLRLEGGVPKIPPLQ